MSPPPAAPAPEPDGIRTEPDGTVRARFRVAYEYPVVFTRNAWAPEHPALRGLLPRHSGLAPHPFLVFADEAVLAAHPGLGDAIRGYARAHSEALLLRADPVPVPGGEAAKNEPGLPRALLGRMLGAGLCRQSTVVAIGGGAVLDAVGFAAAVAHRGLRLLRMPTTVLAQNDAGIGVKNGVNAFGEKNAAGVFAPPLAVVNDFAFLSTLDDRQWIAGAAEAFKVALLKDAAFFGDLLEDAPRLRRREDGPMERLIRRCARLHLEHIAAGGDPFETGSARPLDFGHWSAHRIETLSGHRVSHGEAVSVGIALDCLYAARSGWMTEAECGAALDGLRACGLPVYAPEIELRGAAGERLLLDGLRSFREHVGGALCLSFPRGIGGRIDAREIDRERMDDCIETLARRHRLEEARISAPLAPC